MSFFREIPVGEEIKIGDMFPPATGNKINSNPAATAFSGKPGTISEEHPDIPDWDSRLYELTVFPNLSKSKPDVYRKLVKELGGVAKVRRMIKPYVEKYPGVDQSRNPAVNVQPRKPKKTAAPMPARTVADPNAAIIKSVSMKTAPGVSEAKVVSGDPGVGEKPASGKSFRWSQFFQHIAETKAAAKAMSKWFSSSVGKSMKSTYNKARKAAIAAHDGAMSVADMTNELSV